MSLMLVCVCVGHCTYHGNLDVGGCLSFGSIAHAHAFLFFCGFGGFGFGDLVMVPLYERAPDRGHVAYGQSHARENFLHGSQVELHQVMRRFHAQLTQNLAPQTRENGCHEPTQASHC